MKDNLHMAYISDEEIVEMYWHRDEDAIKATSHKYGRLLYKIAYNILHDNLDCEECQNDTYLNVWNAIPPSKPRSFRAFVVGIMRNIAIDKYYEKSSKKRVPSEMTISMEECLDFIAYNDNPSEFLSAQELAKSISDFLRTLSEKDRYIFMSRFYLSESIDTIARELEISESAVYKRLTKLKADLKKHLIEREVLL